MRISCSAPVNKCRPSLADDISKLGIEPIVTAAVVRAVYEGPDEELGQAIIDLFVQEEEHEICMGDLPIAKTDMINGSQSKSQKSGNSRAKLTPKRQRGQKRKERRKERQERRRARQEYCGEMAQA